MKCAFNGFLLLMDHKLFIWLVGPLLLSCHLTGYSIAHRTRFLPSSLPKNHITRHPAVHLPTRRPPLPPRRVSIVLTRDGFIVFALAFDLFHMMQTLIQRMEGIAESESEPWQRKKEMHRADRRMRALAFYLLIILFLRYFARIFEWDFPACF